MLRCSSVEYARNAPFSRLAHDADVSPTAAPLFFNGLLAEFHVQPRRLRANFSPRVAARRQGGLERFVLRRPLKQPPGHGVGQGHPARAEADSFALTLQEALGQEVQQGLSQ